MHLPSSRSLHLKVTHLVGTSSAYWKALWLDRQLPVAQKRVRETSITLNGNSKVPNSMLLSVELASMNIVRSKYPPLIKIRNYFCNTGNLEELRPSCYWPLVHSLRGINSRITIAIWAVGLSKALSRALVGQYTEGTLKTCCRYTSWLHTCYHILYSMDVIHTISLRWRATFYSKKVLWRLLKHCPIVLL